MRRILSSAAWVLVVCLAGTTQGWALPQCPASHNASFSGSGLTGVVGDFYGAIPRQHDLTMYPCEELWIDVSASSSDPNVNANVYVELYNSDGAQIATKFWPLTWYGSTSVNESNALPLASVGSPLPGTRDHRSLVSQIKIKSDYARPAYPITYTITVHFGQRPGYNRGGLSYADAFGPLAAGTVVRGSMWPLEKNHYRVSVSANGSLTLSGTLVNENWGQAAPITLEVFNMAQQHVTTLLSLSVPANTSHDANGVAVNFTSFTFTNTGAQADFYFVIENGNFARLQDYTITVDGDLVPPPQLTLFLDMNGSFDLDQQSDHHNYVPGAHLVSGASVTLPQSLQLIAAYVDASGQIVPPPGWASSIAFALADTSAFKGIAMNWGDDTSLDFQLGSCVHTTIDGCAFDNTDHTARMALSCRDYGGFTTTSASDQVTVSSFRLPRDGTNGTANWLPDAGWKADGASVADAGLLASDDSDSDPGVSAPPSTGLYGDGLTLFEEFRGFIVSTQHVRTNPTKKDYFATYLQTYGVGFATELPLKLHPIRGPDEYPGAEEFSADRRINANYTNSASGGDIPGHFDQRGIRWRVDQDYVYGYFGFTYATVSGLAVPNEITQVVVWTTSHNDLGHPTRWEDFSLPPGPYTSAQIQNEISRTIGHELGHTLRVCHRGQCAPLDDSQVGISIMNSSFQWGPPVSDPRSQYNAFDIGQIRLHNR
jgi:hypothetical protein